MGSALVTVVVATGLINSWLFDRTITRRRPVVIALWPTADTQAAIVHFNAPISGDQSLPAHAGFRAKAESEVTGEAQSGP